MSLTLIWPVKVMPGPGWPKTDEQRDMLLTSLNDFLYKFVFAPRFRVMRHIVYWCMHTVVWAAFWIIIGSPGTFGREVINMAMWVPAFILYSYPMAYVAIPRLLMKNRALQFLLLIAVWGIAGIYLDQWYRAYIYIPLQQKMGFTHILPRGPLAFCYLCLTTSAAIPMIIQVFKSWQTKQYDWLRAQQEKITAELQLLKAQVHPHFLFNTLNNIYSFSLENSPKTPGLILRLSNLLNYMLYECKEPLVPIEKELDIMKNYIELERERYGSKIDISWNVNGDMRLVTIAPLMMLPFIENAFKHGTSEQIGRSWLSVDIWLQDNRLKAKIANSKNESFTYNGRSNGIGIANVKKRLDFIYPGSHELKINDEGNFFVVSLSISLGSSVHLKSLRNEFVVQSELYEAAVPAH